MAFERFQLGMEALENDSTHHPISREAMRKVIANAERGPGDSGDDGAWLVKPDLPPTDGDVALDPQLTRAA